MVQTRGGFDDKLALILREAAGVFAEKGFHQASIRDISRATGVSLSGLYYYVKSKDELLYLIQVHCFETVLDNLDELLAETDDPGRRLRLLVENHLRFFLNNMREMKVLSHESDTLTGEYRAEVERLKRRYTSICTGILEELRPRESPIELRVATFSLFGMLNWIYNWYRPGRDVPVTELAEDMSQLFLRGWLARDPSLPSGAAEDVPGESMPSIWRR